MATNATKLNTQLKVVSHFPCSMYLIRFNKSRGQEGRGSLDHVWRVFENDKEYLFKHLNISVPIWDETDGNDWNIACKGFMKIDRDTSTAIIGGSNEQTT